MLRIVLALLVLFGTAGAALAESRHVLKGRIIRALAVEPGDPDHILVGHKAGKPGSALVFRSLNGGRDWRTLNGNRPLAAKASDVQAVAALSKSVLLAGTWKHGLYVSRDGGETFDRVAGFPSADIRDLEIVGDTVHAATARHGVFESDDEGRTWRATGPDNDAFLWSVTASNDGLLAGSPEAGVFSRADDEWRRLFKADKAYAAAGRSGLVAIAGETGLHLLIGGKHRTSLAGEKLADVAFAGTDRLLVGSWSKGLVALSVDGVERNRLLSDTSVIHVRRAGDKVLAGTWGDGLHILPLDRLWQ